jgi:hypothetical protein
MAFYDLRHVTRSTLEDVVKFQKPYAGSTNAYPIGDRRYSGRHFRVMPNGDYMLFYAHREHIDGKMNRGDEIPKYAHMGVVRADNTYEFNRAVCQSTTMFLTEALNANVRSSSRHGGGVYSRRSYTHPIFRGLRVDISSGEAKTPYQVFQRRLNQKAAKEEMKAYEEFVTVYGAMISVMDSNSILDVCKDMYAEHGTDMFTDSNKMSMVLRLINEKKYLDAGIIFQVLVESHRNSWMLRSYLADETLHHWGLPNFSNGLPLAYDKFREKVLKSRPHVFIEKEVEAGEELPASTWGLRVVAEGKEVERL